MNKQKIKNAICRVAAISIVYMLALGIANHFGLLG